MKARYIISIFFLLYLKIVLPQTNCQFSLGNDKTFCLPFNYTINGPIGYNSYTWTPGGANTQNLTTSVAGSYTCTALKIGNDLVINGNFSAGNTGFTTNYTPGNGGAYGLLSNEGTAAISNNPNLVHTNFQSFGDHTTGAGNMLICNGSATANDIVWSQTINLNPNTNYLFSAWVASAWGPMNSTEVAQLQFSINGTLIGPVYNASQNGGIWTNFFVNWNSGSSTSAIIRIVDQNIVATGANDFALDDISFKEVCISSDNILLIKDTPPTLTVSATPPIICLGSSTQLNAIGASTYTWSGGITNGVSYTPTITQTYTVTSTSAAGCTNTAVQSITVNNLPTVTVNNATTCAGVSTLLTANGATSYIWSNGDSTKTISVAPLSQTIYTVTGTTLGCTGTATSTVFINPTLNISVNNPTLCLGSSTILTANGATNYTWSTGATTSTIDVIPTTTSVYSVTGETSGCMGYNTSTVTVNSLPIVTASATPSIICEGDFSMLNGSGASTYTWSGGITNGIAFSPAVTSNYTVTGTSAEGCTNTAVQSITVNNLPTVTVNNATTCAGVSTLLTANGATSYIWSNGDSTKTISVAPLSQTIYTVTGTTLGCTGTAISTVFINPTLNISVNNPTLCLGSSTILTANGATNYTWSTGATTYTIDVIPTTTSVYSVTGETSGCIGYNTSTVTVNSLPIVSASATPSIICEGGFSSLNGSGASTYTWSGGITNGVSFTPTITQTYTVTGTSATGCTNTAVQSITVNNLPKITATNGTICIGSSAHMNAFGATSYTWSPSYGLSATTGSLVIANPNTTTIYTVSGTNNGCLSSATGTMVVIPIPTITFNASSMSVFESQPVEITVSGGGTYIWSNGSTSAIIHLYPTQTAVYCATVTSVDGCINSDCIQIPVLESSSLYVPSSFTPNADGLNDLFNVFSTNIIKFEMTIFNRWGELLFTTDDVLKGWDGTYHGKDVKVDVYVYKINAKGIDNIIYKKTGHITLFR